MTVGFFVAILLCAFLIPNVAAKVIADVVLIVLLLAVCILTGSKPGGRSW